MGIKTVRENMSNDNKFSRRPWTAVKNNPAYWLILLLFITLTSLVAIIFRLWLTGIILIGSGLVLTGYVFTRLLKTINKSSDAIKELKEQAEKKDSYISHFSHRIRTPLNNLPLINDLLSHLKVKDEQKELLDTLISSTNNMISALNELTMRSAGEVSIKPRSNIKFDIRKTIGDTIDLLDIESKGNIELNISWDDNIKREYLGDPIAINQVFIDIFSHWSALPANEKVKVNIAVNSTGSKEKDRKKDIIEFLIEADSTAKLKVSSDQEDDKTGRNLSEKIIHLMGGSYQVHSVKGGLKITFTVPVYLPGDKTDFSPVGEKIRKLDTVTRKKRQLSDANVLLVEDNITNQKIVIISLGSKVKNIDTAINGKEALDMFGKSNYDIILMDIQLPVMDGIMASKKIREIEASTSRHTPIIAITANAMIGDKEKCLSANIDDYLSKPFQPKKLIEMIGKYVTGD